MLSIEQIKTIQAQAYAGEPSVLPGVCEVYPTMMVDYIKNPIRHSGLLGLLLLNEQGIIEIMEKNNKNSKKKIDTSNIEPLHFLLEQADKSDGFFLELKQAFSTFIREDILLIPKIDAILVGNNPEEKRLITKDNFSDFQTILMLQNRKEVPTPPPPDESPLAKKMRLLREKAEAVKKKQQQKNGEGEQDLAELLEIGEVFGINYKEKSLYAFYGLLQRHQLKEKWEQDLQMLCAGAKAEDIKATYWALTKKEK